LGVVFQTYEAGEVEAVSVKLAPLQILPSLGVFPDISFTVIIGVGSGFTVTVEVADAVHPFAAVAVTV
jgi:hypothetical protein